MKSFVIKVFENGTYQFSDSQDEASFRRLLSFAAKKGITELTLDVKQYNSGTTDKQRAYYNLIIGVIAQQSGHDRAEVKAQINPEGLDIYALDNKEFSELLEKAFYIANEFFNVNIGLDEHGNLKY